MRVRKPLAFTLSYALNEITDVTCAIVPCVFSFSLELVLTVLAFVSVTVRKFLLSISIFITNRQTAFVHLDFLLIFSVINAQKTLTIFLIHLPLTLILNYMILGKLYLNSKVLLIIVLPMAKVVDKLMIIVLCGQLLLLSGKLFGSHHANFIFLIVAELTLIDVWISDLQAPAFFGIAVPTSKVNFPAFKMINYRVSIGQVKNDTVLVPLDVQQAILWLDVYAKCEECQMCKMNQVFLRRLCSRERKIWCLLNHTIELPVELRV